jgi:hypothetical protein
MNRRQYQDRAFSLFLGTAFCFTLICVTKFNCHSVRTRAGVVRAGAHVEAKTRLLLSRTQPNI